MCTIIFIKYHALAIVRAKHSFTSEKKVCLLKAKIILCDTSFSVDRDMIAVLPTLGCVDMDSGGRSFIASVSECLLLFTPWNNEHFITSSFSKLKQLDYLESSSE
jgi:hypothetical protein